MKIFAEGRSRVLSAAALVLAGLCGAMTALTIYDLVTFARLASTSAFSLFMSRATVPVVMPPLAAFAAERPGPLFLLAALLWLSGFAFALGVWRRAEWARRGAAAMLYLLSAAAGLVMLFPSLIVPAPLIYDGVAVAPEFNAVVKTVAFFLRAAGAAGGGLCFWCARALDRAALKAEFKATEKTP